MILSLSVIITILYNLTVMDSRGTGVRKLAAKSSILHISRNTRSTHKGTHHILTLPEWVTPSILYKLTLIDVLAHLETQNNCCHVTLYWLPSNAEFMYNDMHLEVT